MTRLIAFATLLLVICAACSSSRPRRPRKRLPRQQWVVGTEDPAHPRTLALDEALSRPHHYITNVQARVRRAGTWWYVVEFPDTPGRIGSAAFEASYTGAADLLSLAWVDDHGVAQMGQLTSSSGDHRRVRLELPDSVDLPTRFRLRVVTAGAVEWNLFGRRNSYEPPYVAPPPCDPDHIDPRNPSCKGVFPRCNLNNPDFTNPNCCSAECSFGRLSCRSAIISGGPRWATISLTAKDRIMKYATGRLYQKDKLISEIAVWGVGEQESLIQILEPRRVDMATLLQDGRVVLGQPEPCQRQRR